MLSASASTLVVVMAGFGLLGFSAIAHPHPKIVWNASASMPVGLYYAASGVPNLGDLVLVRTPNSIKMLADERQYLPFGVPLVKRVAATSGNIVCASNRAVAVNGVKVAHQLTADHKGRPLPSWKGCHTLEQDEYFLLGDAPDSFDSRYFGPVKSDRVIGRLVPLWTE